MSDIKFSGNRFWMITLVILFSSVSAALLTTINIATKGRIALNEEIKLKRSVLKVFGIPYDEKHIIEIFNRKVKTDEAGGRPFYLYYENRLRAVAFEAKGSGFWGPISVMFAVSPDFETIKGIEILHQEETPGLGGRITEEGFKEQFKGRSVMPEITVDAITGATMTSKAFKKLINENVRTFRKKYEKRQEEKK